MEVDYRRHRLESSESESEASRSEKEVEVERRRKVKYFRLLFGGLITVRRAVQLRQSQTEVLQEHKLFRIMQEWRKMAVIGRKKQLQAEIMQQRNEWRTKRQCLKQWASIVRKSKMAEQHYLAKVFQALKLTCCSQYAIRVRKIQLQTVLSKAKTHQFLHLLQTYRRQMQAKQQLAVNHYRSRVQEICFNSLQTTQAKGKRSRIRYQEYRLAHLFHVHALLRKAWKALSN